MVTRAAGRAALLVLDPQAAFLTGCWAACFPPGDCELIASAFDNLAMRLSPGGDIPADTPIIRSMVDQFPTDADRALAEPVTSVARLADAPCVIKNSTNVLTDPRFTSWLTGPLVMGRANDAISTLVIGGCTTTSCVRVSAQAVKRAFPDLTTVVVDRSICGARRQNHERAASSNPTLVRIHGAGVCDKASAVGLAVRQMRAAGVLVVERFDFLPV